jgi:hypothetical protein
MITVGTFSKPEDAHLLKMRLEAGGVRAFVQDENLVQWYWLYSNAIGGVRVQISNMDREQAIAILSGEQANDLPDAVDSICPFCGSTDVGTDELPRRIAFAMLIVLSFPMLFGRTKYHCASCRRKWNK